MSKKKSFLFQDSNPTVLRLKSNQGCCDTTEIVFWERRVLEKGDLVFSSLIN